MLQKCKDVPGDPPGPDLLNYEAGHLDSREKKDDALGRGPAPRREPPAVTPDAVTPPAVTPDAVTPDTAPRTPATGLASCRKPRKQQAAGQPCPEPGLGAATGAWGKPPTSGFQAPAKLQVP